MDMVDILRKLPWRTSSTERGLFKTYLPTIDEIDSAEQQEIRTPHLRLKHQFDVVVGPTQQIRISNHRVAMHDSKYGDRRRNHRHSVDERSRPTLPMLRSLEIDC